MIRKIQYVQLPGDVNSAVVDRVKPQATASNDQSYWKAFSDGFVEGFSLPFQALFGLAGCSSRPFPLVDKGETIIVPCDTSSDAGVHNDAADEVDAADATVDASPTDTSEDVCQDFCAADLVDAEEVALPDAVTEDVAPDVEDTVEDIAADIPEDVTLSDAAEDVALPEDATTDVDEDTFDSGICQYFCDAGISETDVGLPADVTLTDDATATDVSTPTGVASKMCSTPVSGPLTLSAPLNTVAAACTNDTINSLILGATGCVAECGFYDNNVILSTAPNTPVKFALDLFAPPQTPIQVYTITLSLQAPVFSDGSTPALPGFMGSSFVFAFNQKLYDTVGDIVWDAQDNDPKGNLQGTVQIKYQPQDFFFQLPEFLDITYTDLVGNKVGYRYPCDTLVDSQGVSNAIINCTEVK